MENIVEELSPSTIYKRKRRKKIENHYVKVPSRCTS